MEGVSFGSGRQDGIARQFMREMEFFFKQIHFQSSSSLAMFYGLFFLVTVIVLIGNVGNIWTCSNVNWQC
jgi:hypothetical protein